MNNVFQWKISDSMKNAKSGSKRSIVDMFMHIIYYMCVRTEETAFHNISCRYVIIVLYPQ